VEAWLAGVAHPTVVVGLLAPSLIYAWGVHRLWRDAGHGRGVTRRQAILFASGIIVLGAALLSPLDVRADDSFSAHMVQHLLIICIAAPLLVLGVPGIAFLWALPRPARATFGRQWGERGPIPRRVLAFLGTPAVAWMLHALALAFWHVPGPYDWALAHAAAHAAEHCSFLLTACLFWWVVLPGTGSRRLGYGAAVLYVTAMGMVMGIYGAVLTFAPHVWYAPYAARTASGGLTPLADQQLAGVIMWIPTSIVYLGAALWCFAAWLKVEAGRHDGEGGLVARGIGTRG
jgi:putative membrane protein